ncbi:MAG: hypothetical protein JW870_13405 [Candidatus Delongbacteria bacterium]|nr:hypothetical protein [Candidatus Delongbacteria bacterium]
MSKLDVNIRLRPIRFAFLVRPNDRPNVQRIFEINTCLWGGKFNPIIPYFERIPTWWSRDKHNYEKPKQIIEGYINYFEPDFIVEAEKGLGKKLNLPDEIIANIDDFHFDESYPGYKEIRGLNVLGLYKELYQKEFKYVRRHKHGIILAITKEQRFELFSSCLFGSFPQNKKLSYIKNGFQDVFDPEKIDIKPDHLKEIYKRPHSSPLDIGCKNIDIYYSDQDLTVFILDITQPKDLIDFWNLRIFKKYILAVPVQWLEVLSEFCRELAIKNHRPLPGNHHGVTIDTTFLFSRSITKEKIDTITPSLIIKEKKDAVVFQYLYPNFWEKKSDMVLSPYRAILTAKESKQEVTIDNDDGMFRFNNLSPDFVNRFTSSSSWANIIHIKEELDKNEIATIFPASIRNPSFPNLSFYNKRILSNSEGLIDYQNHNNWYENWKAIDGTSAFKAWFKTQNINTEISTAGKTLLQIIKSLKGFWGVRYISHPVIIERLNSMACKLSKSSEEIEGARKEYLGRTVKYHDLKKEINEISEDISMPLFWKKKVIELLIKYNVIKLGLEIKCNVCDHRNWYSIDSLKYELICENCLKTFSFPQHNPSNREIEWCYRVIGPFAKPDYAQGAYASALALRFFKDIDSGLSSSLTWCTSLELDQKNEVDFLLWYQRKRIIENNYGVDLVFGESKSFAKNAFKEKDLKSLQNLALRFPGSILVCATMKDKLDKKEKERIAKMALWGRANTSMGITRAPLIVLTATELFSLSSFGLRFIWEKKGGKHAQLIKPGYIREDNLRVLADLTQQVYLDLPSYHQWLNAKWEKKRIKRKSN